MYLLEITFEEFIYWFIGTAIGLWILYAIIRAAVKAGTKGLKDQLRLQNNLKGLEMEKAGWTKEQLKELKESTLNFDPTT